MIGSRETAATSPDGQRTVSLTAVAVQCARSFYHLCRWLADASALAFVVISQAIRPLTWRRPVRAEFFRFLDITTVQAVPSVAVAGGLVGFGVITHSLFWIAQTGEIDLVYDVIVVVFVQEITPLLTGFLAIGTSGLIILQEVGSMRSQGQLRMLDSQGVDPLLAIILPRVLAMTLGVFCLTMVFLISGFVIAHLASAAMGLPGVATVELPLLILDSIGSAGYAALPTKTLSIGFIIGIVCCKTALETGTDGRTDPRLLSRGFVRAVVAVILASGLTTVLL